MIPRLVGQYGICRGVLKGCFQALEVLEIARLSVLLDRTGLASVFELDELGHVGKATRNSTRVPRGSVTVSSASLNVFRFTVSARYLYCAAVTHGPEVLRPEGRSDGKKFFTIRSANDLSEVLSKCTPSFVTQLATHLNLERRLESIQNTLPFRRQSGAADRRDRGRLTARAM